MQHQNAVEEHGQQLRVEPSQDSLSAETKQEKSWKRSQQAAATRTRPDSSD
jgi:hypothetical protein